MAVSTYAVPVDIPRAARALRALARNPDDTTQVFTIVRALAGRSPDYLVGLFRSNEYGRTLLRERPDLLSTLVDRDLLLSMPEGSLGHAYLAFVESEGITAEGLVAASDAAHQLEHAEGSEYEYATKRVRDTHDLWHTVTGYKGDLVGEVALLAFSACQVRNPGLAAMVVIGLARLRKGEAIAVALQSIGRALAATSLVTVDWESLLPLPLEEVRRTLSLGPPPDYTPVRTAQLSFSSQARSTATCGTAPTIVRLQR